MTKPAALFANYCHAEFMQGLKVLRIRLEIPKERSQEFFNAFGYPDAANPVPVFIARIDPNAVVVKPAEQSSGAQAPPSDKKRSSLAHVKCLDPVFKKWLGVTHEPLASDYATRDAIALLKNKLGIESRTELDEPGPKADAFDRMLTSFDAETKWGVK